MTLPTHAYSYSKAIYQLWRVYLLHFQIYWQQLGPLPSSVVQLVKHPSWSSNLAITPGIKVRFSERARWVDRRFLTAKQVQILAEEIWSIFLGTFLAVIRSPVRARLHRPFFLRHVCQHEMALSTCTRSKHILVFVCSLRSTRQANSAPKSPVTCHLPFLEHSYLASSHFLATTGLR